MNQCKWCEKKLKSKRKVFCNTYCATNFIEMTNIELPNLWVKNLKKLNPENQAIAILKFSEMHKHNPEFVERKINFLKEKGFA